MLSPVTYDNINNPLDEILRTLEMAIITSIAAHMADAAVLTATDIYNLETLQIIRRFDEDIVQLMSTMTKKSMTAIENIFERAATESVNFHRDDYERLRYDFMPYEKNTIMQRLTRSYASQTKNAFKNLTRSSGFIDRQGNLLQPHDYFTRMLSNASVAVSTGAFTYDDMIKRTVKDMAANGLRTSIVIDEKGKPQSIGGIKYPHLKNPREVVSSVRANVLTSIGQMTQEIEFINGEELGLDLIETSAHTTARESHQKWQGRRFSFNGTIKELKQKIAEIRKDERSQRLVENALK